MARIEFTPQLRRFVETPGGRDRRAHLARGARRGVRGAHAAARQRPAPRIRKLSDFAFAVAAHPGDGDSAWFVPAMADRCRVPKDGALVVNRTCDAGKSFETLREGLPQDGCYDLVYRHGLAVAPDGRHLLMGSTTGGLWASLDGGDVDSPQLPAVAAPVPIDRWPKEPTATRALPTTPPCGGRHLQHAS